MDSVIEIAGLNIVATPHPDGVYRRLFNAIADVDVKLGGSDWGKIRKPRVLEDRPNILVGEFLLWAHIDPESPWLNTDKNIEATPAEKQAVVEALPGNLEPNFRSFNFAFLEKKHHLVVEIRNELGHRFAPSRAERMLVRLFDKLGDDFPDVDVTIIPEEDTLKKILAIPRLQKLEIYIKRPNADDLGDAYERLIEQMQEEGAGAQLIEKIKAPKVKTLKPSDETIELAENAMMNGYVSAKGKDAEGKIVKESTKEHPKTRKLDVHASSFGTFLAGLHHFD